MQSENKRPILKKRKNPFFKWNGEINLGNILTILTIVIAASAFYYQKISVETKVDDLKVVVDSLNSEKLSRQLQGLQGEEKGLRLFSYNLGYTVDQLRATQNIYDNEIIFMLNELNDIIDVELKKENITVNDKKMFVLLKEINMNRQEILAHGQIYDKKIVEFTETNEPKEAGFKSTEEFNAVHKIYEDTLSKHIRYLQFLLDSFMKEPAKKLKQLEGEYLSLKKLNPKTDKKR